MELADFDALLERLFKVTDDLPKLMLCGPRYMGMMTGCYNPKYWPRLRGNALQRRTKRRHLTRMWAVTKDSPYLSDPPSRLLPVF